MKQGLEEKYSAVFQQQLEDNIIERIPLTEDAKTNNIWVPHRPVIREDSVSSKIRPVFNCSLKTKRQLPSINEAAYPGVDLMNSLVQLLISFRPHKFSLLADVKQAFLQIKLKKEEDRNRFCFLLRKGSK